MLEMNRRVIARYSARGICFFVDFGLNASRIGKKRHPARVIVRPVCDEGGSDEVGRGALATFNVR